MAGPNYVNFTPQLPGMSYGGFPPEMQQEAQKLARRQMIADAMLQKGMQAPSGATQVVSGIAIPNSPLAGIAQMFAPYVAERMQGKLDEDKAALATRYNNQLGEAVRNYATKTTGGPEVLPEGQAGPTRPFVPASDEARRGAIIEAMASGYGPLREIAATDWKEMLKNQLTVKDIGALMKDFTTESVQAFVASGGKTPLQRNPNYRAAGDVTFDTTSGQPGPAVNKFSPVGPLPGTGVDGQPPVIGQTNTATGKANFAPRGTNVNVDMGAKKGAETQAASMTKSIEESAKAAHEASAALRTIAQASEIFNSGVRMGSATELRNTIDKFLVTAGFKDDKGNLIANTGNLQRVMADLALNSTQKLRPVSNDELKFLVKMKSGQDATPQEFKQLLELVTETSIGTINEHNARVNRMPEHTEGYRASMLVGSPVKQIHIRNPGADGSQTTPIDLDAEAKRLGGRKIQ